jgi:hypothetical protein
MDYFFRLKGVTLGRIFIVARVLKIAHTVMRKQKVRVKSIKVIMVIIIIIIIIIIIVTVLMMVWWMG